MNSKRTVGVDVGKAWLDVAYEGDGDVVRYPNSSAGITALLGTLDPAHDLVVFERCGGYETRAGRRTGSGRRALGGGAFGPGEDVSPSSGHQGQDRRDRCAVLQAFGRDRLNTGQLRLGRVADVTFDALVARQGQLVAARHAERCRRETAAIETVRASIDRMIAQIEAELEAVAAELRAHEAADPQLVLKAAVMCERKGVAHATTRALLAQLPELGSLNRREIASLGGMAPRVHQSGRTQLRRGLAPGRPAVKTILFNPARCAMQFDPEIKAFCTRLRARGKPGKVIMVAVMRKLLVRLNAAVRDALNQQEVSHSADRRARCRIIKRQSIT
jgi:transposase